MSTSLEPGTQGCCLIAQLGRPVARLLDDGLRRPADETLIGQARLGRAQLRVDVAQLLF